MSVEKLNTQFSNVKKIIEEDRKIELSYEAGTIENSNKSKMIEKESLYSNPIGLIEVTYRVFLHISDQAYLIENRQAYFLEIIEKCFEEIEEKSNKKKCIVYLQVHILVVHKCYKLC